MNVLETRLPGVLIIEPDVFGDARGFFMETWSQERYREVGLPAGFVQDNLSRSARGVLRGLHFQSPHPQGKLISVLEGEVFDVAVDVRTGSPTFGEWVGEVLSSVNRRQLYVPEGFAHGFVVTDDTALFSYKCTEYYHPETERSILWNDPEIGIEWPIGDPILSDKDGRAPRLAAIPSDKLPRHAEATGRIGAT